MSGPKGGDDNRANQLNRNNDAYWQSRGYPERPTDWTPGDDDGDDTGGEWMPDDD